MSKQFYFKQFSLALAHNFGLFSPLIGSLSGATTHGQSGPWCNGNEGVLNITGTSPPDFSVSYQDTRRGVLTLCRDAIGVFSSPSRLGQLVFWNYIYLFLSCLFSGGGYVSFFVCLCFVLFAFCCCFLNFCIPHIKKHVYSKGAFVLSHIYVYVYFCHLGSCTKGCWKLLG